MLSVENLATIQETRSAHVRIKELDDEIYKLTLRILVAEKKNSDLQNSLNELYRRIDAFNSRSSQKI